MNPLGISASWMDPFHCLSGLLAVLDNLASAPDDIASLKQYISNIKTTLEGFQSTTSLFLPTEEHLLRLRQPVASGLANVSRLEALVEGSLKKKEMQGNRRGTLAMDSVVWVYSKRKTKAIKRQLQDSITSITLVILSLICNSIRQLVMSSKTEHFGTTLQEMKTKLESIHENLQDPVRSTDIVHTTLSCQSSNTTIDKNISITGLSLERNKLSWNKHSSVTRSTSQNLNVSPLDCPELVSCSTSQKFWTFFGLLVVEYTQCFNHKSHSHHFFSWSLSVQVASSFLAYYTSWHPGKNTLMVSYQSLPSLSISLSFPCILPPDSDIFVSIRAGRIERVKTLLIEGRGLIHDVAAPYGFLPLSLALSYGRMDIYELLLSAGANRCNLVSPYSYGSSVFGFWSTFSSQEHSSLMEYLSYAGADSDSFRLHKCVLGLTSESLRIILPAVSDIDEGDALGRTALHIAAYRSDHETIDLLLKPGANSGLKDSTCRTPLHISVALGSVACTKALAAGGANLQARDQFGNSPLHNACKLGHLQVVKTLLAHGADIKMSNYAGGSPVMHANIGNHLPVIQLLKQHGADLTHGDSLGNTVVHDAVWFNLHEPLTAHLELGLRVDQKLRNGKSILHLLAEEGDQITIQIFLDFAQNGLGRVNINDTDNRGRTAMDYLERRRDVAEVSELFQLVLESVLVASRHNEVFWDAVERQSGDSQ